MQNSGCNLKEAVEILYKDNAHKINLDWKKLIEDFKEYKNISNIYWEKIGIVANSRKLLCQSL